MRNLVIKIKRTFASKEFFKFLIIGVLNTFNGALFSTLYGLWLQVNIAFIFGYISSLIIAYILNSKFVFICNLKIEAFVKFAISYIPNFIIQNLVVLVMYNLLGLSSVITYGIAAIIGIPITFLCVKVFAFGKVDN